MHTPTLHDILHRLAALVPHASETQRADLHAAIEAHRQDTDAEADAAAADHADA